MNKNDMNKNNKNVLNFKFIIIGDTSVGKTSLLFKYINNEFPQTFKSTIGVDAKFKEITYKGFKIKVRIYDTAGQEVYKSIVKNYFRNCDGIFLVFDLTNKYSFNNLKMWMEEIESNISKEKINLVILGNKSDLLNIYQVFDNDIEEFENNKGVKIIKTSARNGDGIKEAFENMFDILFSNKNEEEIYQEYCHNYRRKISLKNNKVKSSNINCC